LKLKREVAIKILTAEFSRDPERISRFQREAELLASLNHPDIEAIYDVEECADCHGYTGSARRGMSVATAS
jgi:serine/threonine-protein kinase